MQRFRRIVIVFGLGVLVGCMTSGPPAPAEPPAPPAARDSASAAARRDRDADSDNTSPGDDSCGYPLLLDRTDLRMGTSVHFNRVPTASEVHDLWTVAGLSHVVVSLREWPADFEPLQGLGRLPDTADLVIVLRGYPPKPSAINVWGYLSVTARVIVVVPGPPPSQTVVEDLNAMRSLERVIVEMDYPSRSGLERLHRPVSFRKLMR